MEMVVSVVMTLLYGVMDGENKTIRSLLPMEYMSKMWKKSLSVLLMVYLLATSGPKVYLHDLRGHGICEDVGFLSSKLAPRIMSGLIPNCMNTHAVNRASVS